MLIQARRARTANTSAPIQERRSYATGQVRWTYGPSILFWLHAQTDTSPGGATVSSANDWSGAGVAISQAVAARQPLKGAVNNAAAFQFDGVNDWFNLGSVGLSGQAITVATIEKQTNSAFAYQIDLNTVAPRAYLGRWNVVAARNVSAAVQGNVGWSSMWSTAGFNNLVGIVAVLDMSKASGSEVALYADGSAPATATGAAENTGSFSATTGAIGATAAGTGGGPYGGFICSLIILKASVTAAQAAQLNTVLRQAAGVA